MVHNEVFLVERLAALGRTLAAAESCTAGLVADMIASVPGASRVFWGSFVTYMLDAKTVMLGLDRAALEKYGAVSRETACAMAEAALAKSGAGAAVSVTGLAGPDGDGTSVPVGTVWVATALAGGASAARVFHFKGERDAVRRAAAEAALQETLDRLSGY
ncbi:MAG: nicotinamide-nucleotide amidohydrolase family protein [Treponema sp.]|jgi:PncC family amidohydrolase|nr:nicotinamide-nucleotide amidohydrolase family protein [Treponema sp.]